MAKKKKRRNKKKKITGTHIGNIMTKAHVHINEDKRLYNRKQTRKDEKRALEE